MTDVLEDKTQHCLQFILGQLRKRQPGGLGSTPVFVVGINGAQGVGKTTLVCSIDPSSLRPECRSAPLKSHYYVLFLLAPITFAPTHRLPRVVRGPHLAL